MYRPQEGVSRQITAIALSQAFVIHLIQSCRRLLERLRITTALES
jgi:hypothetical protein